MSCREVEAGSRRYRFCPVDPVPDVDRMRSIVRWTVEDEISEMAPEIEFSLTTTHPTLVTRVARGGVMGLVGNPARLFPGLDLGSVELVARLSAPGFLPRTVRATLGPIPGFPATFAPADLGVVALHRAEVVLRGRAVSRTAPVPQLAGVDLELTGLWSTFPQPADDPTAIVEAAALVSLAPGLYADRLDGVDQVSRRAMVLAAGEEKTLRGPATVGSTRVMLSDRVNLIAGSVLALEPTTPDRAEYLTVTAVDPAATDDQPAAVVLAHPLARAHAHGATCVRATPDPPTVTHAFDRDGIPGDRVAFLSGIGGLATGAVVEVGGGGAATEYQTVALYRATSGGDGYFRLPPLGRVAMARLVASRVDLGALELIISPDYRCYENRIDVVFP